MHINSLTEIAAAWVAALEADETLNAWCTAQYGRKPMLFNGADRKNEPKADEAPWILVDPDLERTGLEAESLGYDLVVVCCVVHEKGKRVVGGDGDRVVTLEALGKVEAMAALVLNILAETDFTPDLVVGELSDEFYPLVLKGLTITTEVETVLDGSRSW